MTKAEELWKQLGDIPITNQDLIDEPFLHFPIGTEKEEIWHWFEEEFNLSIVEDLMTNKTKIKDRLTYLRQEIKAERISTAEIAELQALAQHIESGDTLLLEWAGVPEFKS